MGKVYGSSKLRTNQNVKGTKLPKSLHKKDGKNHQNLPSVSPNFGPFSPKFDMPKTMQSHWESQ